MCKSIVMHVLQFLHLREDTLYMRSRGYVYIVYIFNRRGDKKMVVCLPGQLRYMILHQQPRSIRSPSSLVQ